VEEAWCLGGSTCFVAGKEKFMALHRAWHLIGQESFFTSWTWIIICIVVLVALLGLFFYLRSQREEED
jgi:hypothetical protein